MYSVWPFGPTRKIPCFPLARLSVRPEAVAGPILRRAAKGPPAPEGVPDAAGVPDEGTAVVLGVAVFGGEAAAGDEPYAARATAITATAPKDRGRTVSLLIKILSAFCLARAPGGGCTAAEGT